MVWYERMSLAVFQAGAALIERRFRMKLPRNVACLGKTVASLSLLSLSTALCGFSQDTLKVTISPSIVSPSPVGKTVIWTATAHNASGRITYRFLTGPAGGKLSVVRDFSIVNTLPWSELSEGTYHILVEVRDTNKQTGQIGAAYTFVSRVTAGQPVVSTTENPLVALYSAPACATGSTLQVSFWPADNSEPTMSAPVQNCAGALSLNTYVGGMLPNKTYNLQQTTVTAGKSTTGPQLTFTTGAVNYTMPDFTAIIPPGHFVESAQPVLLMSYKALKATPPLYPSPTAVDLNGNVLWYYWDPESPSTPKSEYLTRPVEGGTFLILMWGGALREVDLAGNIVRETNVGRISEQLAIMGTNTIDWLSHEALRLPNGHTVTLGSAERILDVQCGSSCPVDVVGDLIIDLDENFQVDWYWNSFDHLNTARAAVLGEQCGASGSDGVDKCGNLKLATVANDWTHANSLLLTSDNNLTISLRNQDYVVKVNYDNATGNGDVIWVLGNEGNCGTPGCTAPAFTIATENAFYQDTWPWFSHQHDVEFDGTNWELYDNGNTRVSPPPLGLGLGDSRGYVFALDETGMIISVVDGFDLKSFNPGFGAAQLLTNGDYTFTNGTLSDGLKSQVMEIHPSVQKADFNLQWDTRSYRSFRLVDLYTYTQ
jgi:arylsulfate sulfotransferase